MSRNLVERYWGAQDPFDPETLATLRHADWSAEWPQSAERIPSHEADVAIHGGYPGYPAHRMERTTGSDEVWKPLPAVLLWTPVRITGASDMWIAEAHLEYPEDGLWHAVVSLELRDGLVWRETVYYCRTFESPPWPDAFAEQAPGALPPLTASAEHNAEAERLHADAHARYLDVARRDPAAAARGLFVETAVVDRPQSGRRVTGIENIAEAHEAQRHILPGQVRRLLNSGHVQLAESRLDHRDQTWFLVTIAAFDKGRVARMTEYLAESYPAPEWRSAWVEPLTENG
jgi:hypothetical protein